MKGGIRDGIRAMRTTAIPRVDIASFMFRKDDIHAKKTYIPSSPHKFYDFQSDHFE